MTEETYDEDNELEEDEEDTAPIVDTDPVEEEPGDENAVPPDIITENGGT